MITTLQYCILVCRTYRLSLLVVRFGSKSEQIWACLLQRLVQLLQRWDISRQYVDTITKLQTQTLRDKQCSIIYKTKNGYINKTLIMSSSEVETRVGSYESSISLRSFTLLQIVSSSDSRRVTFSSRSFSCKIEYMLMIRTETLKSQFFFILRRPPPFFTLAEKLRQEAAEERLLGPTKTYFKRNEHIG